MRSSLAGFVNIWTPALYSTNERIAARNVRQGGNDLLAVIPQGFQAMWAGHVLAQAASVATGPLAAIAQLFRVLFHPVVAFPLSITACAVKNRMYESSTPCLVKEQTKFYARGEEVDEVVSGTVAIHVNGQLRHFILGNNITSTIENSIVIENDGTPRRFHYQPLLDDESLDADCLEINLNGEKRTVRLLWEVDEVYTELSCGGERKYYQLAGEAPEPLQGTVVISGVDGKRRYHRIGAEIANQTTDCVCSKIETQEFYYDMGRELEGPAEGAVSFTIEGKVRYFSSAKFVSRPSLGLSGIVNEIPKMPFKIPTKLHRLSVQAFELVNKHISDVIRIALLVSSAIFLFFGHTYMAAGAILAVSYEYLDHDLGVIPKKVSLFIEKRIALISMMGLLITGSPTSQIMAGATLLLNIPSVGLWAHHKIANMVRSLLIGFKQQLLKWFIKEPNSPLFKDLMKILENYPKLEECDVPLIPQKNLSAVQIRAILDGDQNHYSLNPAFLTKNFEPQLQLAKNANFTELNRLWEEMGRRWLEPNTYDRLFKRLIDDQRFICFVQQKFPEAKRFFFEDKRDLSEEENRQRYNQLFEVHKNQFDQWIQAIALEQGFRTNNDFIASWVKKQLQLYIGKISGNLPIEGEQQFLRDAAEQTAQILPFLLNPETTEIEKEDALVKLAIEGGGYCSLAMKRASKEILEGFTEPLMEKALEGNRNGAFEGHVGWMLQKFRLQYIQAGYKVLASQFNKNEKTQDTAEDIHLYEAFKQSAIRGYHPMSEEEIQRFTLTELLAHQTIMWPLHAGLLEAFQKSLPSIMEELGIDRLNIKRNKILEYLRVWVEENKALKPEERDLLLQGSLSNIEEQMTDPDNYPKWSRLFMLVIGLMKENAKQSRQASPHSL